MSSNQAEAQRQNNLVKFFDPHPGYAGARIKFFPVMLAVVHDLDGKTGTIEEAVRRLEEAGKEVAEYEIGVRAITSAIDPRGAYIAVSAKSRKSAGYGHSFRALSFEPIA